MTMTAEDLQTIQSQIRAIDKDAAKGVKLARLFEVEPTRFSQYRNGKAKIPPRREALIRRVIDEKWGIGLTDNTAGITEKKPPVEDAPDALESTKRAAPVSHPSEPPAPGKPKKSRVADLPKLTVYLELDDKKLLRAASWVMDKSESRLLVSAFREWIETLQPDQRRRIETIAKNM